MLLNHILWKYTPGYKLSKSQEKINLLMNMDDIKLFDKNDKKIGNPKNKLWEYTVQIQEWNLA